MATSSDPQVQARWSGIDDFTLADVDPRDEHLLRVSLAGDTVCLSIETCDETHESRTYKIHETIVVDLEPLFNGISASMLSQGWKPAL